MTKKPYEPAIISHFYRKNKMEDLMVMEDEEVMQRIDEYLETYIASWQKRNKGKDLPEIQTSTIAMVRDKRTNVRKAPIVGKR
jgi:DNA-binding Lrp family transcriptional regulator